MVSKERYGSRGTFTPGTFDFEDAGIGQALQFLSQVGRADQNRLLVLRSASDYTIQPQGQNPAQFLASENSGGVSGFQEARRSQCNIRPWVLKAAPRLRSV